MSEGLGEYSHFFEVKLDLFNGPIDLLLHLVKQRELPIEELSLAAVADQYMRCIDAMQQFDLDVAGEYLVIAATLLSIKSSILLNDPVTLVEDDEGNLVNPHEELLRKLREAEIYKEGASHLSRTPYLGLDVFAPKSSLDEHEDPEVRYMNHDPLLLGRAFKKLLERAGTDVNLLTISVDSVSIVEHMMKILDRVRAEPQGVVFHTLIPDLSSRAAIVSTFIALLELCKRQAISVRQDGSFDEIYVVLASADMPAQELHSEFDQEAVSVQGVK